MKILVFCHDTFHPAAIVRTGFELLAQGHDFEFDWVEDATEWPTDALKDYPIAVLAKSNVRSPTDPTPWLSGATEGIFHNHVARGGGLLVVHSGTASYKDVIPVRAVTGGTFLSHPPQCRVILKPSLGHTLTKGLTEPFTVFDEHYQMALDDPCAEVFLHSHSVHGEQPAGWARTEGKGRVAVLTPGHNGGVWLHPSFQQLLTNSLRWLARL